MRNFEENVSTQSFMRFLSESEKTALLTVETPSNTTSSKLETFLARGEIRLYKFRQDIGIKRFISIEKFKGSSHMESILPMELNENGLAVHARAS
jgi:KaiC/GvpD/RAD55 family RecA-like ATPase